MQAAPEGFAAHGNKPRTVGGFAYSFPHRHRAIYRPMRKNLVSPLIAATALVLACATAQAQDRAETLFNLVSVSAQAEREVANDTLTAVMAVDSEGSDPAALADGTNRAMHDALKLAQAYRGVKARSLNYQTWPVYDKARIVRWRVRQELRLESREFAQATELIGKLQSTLVVSSLAVGLSSEARKQADRLACEAWNQRMLGYKGRKTTHGASGSWRGIDNAPGVP